MRIYYPVLYWTYRNRIDQEPHRKQEQTRPGMMRWSGRTRNMRVDHGEDGWKPVFYHQTMGAEPQD